MRSFFILGLVLGLAGQLKAGGTTADSVRILMNQVEVLDHKIDQLLMQLHTQAAAMPGSKSLAPEPGSYTAGEYLLILLPVLVFLLFCWLVFNRLKRSGFRISEALSAVRPKKVKTVSLTFGVDGTQTSRVEQDNTHDEFVRSTSRVLAFLTTICVLLIAVMLTSFLGYQMITGNGRNVSVDGLWKILLVLGVGVLPYAVNVLRGNTKEGHAGRLVGNNIR